MRTMFGVKTKFFIVTTIGGADETADGAANAEEDVASPNAAVAASVKEKTIEVVFRFKSTSRRHGLSTENVTS